MKFSLRTFLQALFLLVIVLGVYFSFADFASLKFNTADASTYLNIAENIATHHGFVVSYDLYQSFTGLYHPVWPYMQSLYPVLFSIVFMLHGGLEQVIKLNILIFGINAALIFYIVQRLIPTSFNILFSFFLVISLNFYISALYAWTEQLHFFCLIVTFILFLRFKDHWRHLLWLGALNGIFMMIRTAHLYNFLAFIPVIFIGKDTLSQKFNRVFSFIGGFVVAYGLYQLFCFLSCHAFYPEYARSAVSYSMAHFDSGVVYDLKRVGFQAPLVPFFTLQHFLYIGQHLEDFYKQMPNFLWPALFYYFLPINKRAEGGIIELCFFQSIFTCLGYSLTFYWLRDSFDSLRYSMIPYVLISVVGWYSLYQGLQISASMGRKLFGLLVLACLFISPQVHKFITFRDNVLGHPYMETRLYRDLMASCHWIDKNLPKEILVASSENQQGYFMHRPFIPWPPGKSCSCTNLILYNRIYSPDYYLMPSRMSDECFSSIPHAKIFSNQTFKILEIKKNPK